ncbi:interferon alpha-1-like [Acipenser ruthenus]|uniref:interferon alpha-1-like n=1 Tax=Acipenser ruthenus TaxID=7906 RepID=UPI002740F643|nr:interferon alpha-1-like [Acipenser ruthenus]
MAQQHFWTFCLVLTFVPQVLSLECKWMDFHFRHKNELSTGFLKDMGGKLPLKCLTEQINLQFPQNAYNSEDSSTETTVLIAYNVLNHVFNLFDETLTPVSWDLSKLHYFKNILFRQTGKLEECMEGQTAFAGDLHSFADRSELLKTYFEKMENVLKDKNHSVCAWEIVRMQVIRNLEQLHMMLDRAGNP